MTPPNNLEVNGNLREHPLAELLVEISRLKLNGSLRISNAEHKAVIYLDAGDVVFAVSNSRTHRLYEMLLRENKVSKEQIVAIANFTNDLALSEVLLKKNFFQQNTANAMFSRQIEEILLSIFDWQTGDWAFSPLVRIKGDIRFQVNLQKLLISYARNLPLEEFERRFKGANELFRARSEMPVEINLLPSEAFVLSRFEKSALTVKEIQSVSGLPEIPTFQILYILWLGGFLSRQDWNQAFSRNEAAAIRSARLTLKSEAVAPPKLTTAPVSAVIEFNRSASENGNSEPPEIRMSLEEYLDRIENAAHYYEVFDLATDAEVPAIKKSYFNLAKQFHPDLYHTETDTRLFERIQNAFTKCARAYETLKTSSSREVYDYKLRKSPAETQKRQSGGNFSKKSENSDLPDQNELAAESFEQGCNCLMDKNFDTAIALLARAVHFAKGNALYHAYYGKALSLDGRQQHKAEAELQTAIKLDGENADYRLFLAEFFIQVGLNKRAEGELNRLLAISPGHTEAHVLLDSLAKR